MAEKPTAIYEFTTIDHVRVRDIQNNTIKSVAFNHNGSLLAFTYDNKFKMYKMNGDKVEEDPIEKPHGEKIYFGIESLSFHPTLPFLLTGSHDSTAKLWRISTESGLSANCVATTAQHVFITSSGVRPQSGPCYSVAFHPTGPVFATGSNTKTVKLWRFNPQVPEQGVLTPVKTLENITDYNVYSVAFHPTMPFLAASDSRYAKLWQFSLENLEETTYVATLGMSSALIAANERYVAAESAAAAAANEVTIKEFLDARTEVDVQKKLPNDSHDAPVTSVAFHPREPILVTGSWDNTAKLWSFSPDGSVANVTCLATLVHDRELRRVAFHPDPRNSILATCSLDNKINLWRLSSSGKNPVRITTIVDLVDDEPVLYSMAFHPTLERPSFRLVSGGKDITVKLWKVTENIANPDMEMMLGETGSSIDFMTISEKQVKDNKEAEKGRRSGGKNRTRHRRRLSRKQQRSRRNSLSLSRSRSRSRGRRHRRVTSKNPH